MRCVISVLGKDRAGIVAGISGVLAEKGRKHRRHQPDHSR